LIAESDLNDSRVVRPSALGGYGLDAMWCDDFHHAAHALITGERTGYYSDFGKVEDLARAWRSAMSRAGEYSSYRMRRHGRAAPELRAEQCVVCMQNHDQVGNRLLGERLSALVGFEQQKLAAGLVCLAPFIPLLFMGEEFGATAPFLYFVDHGDAELLAAIRRGRAEEFASFGWSLEGVDPGVHETLQRCILNHELRASDPHATLHALYRSLLRLRAALPTTQPDDTISFEAQQVLLARRGHDAWMAFSLSSEPCELTLPIAPGAWALAVASASADWGGPGHHFPPVSESQGEMRAVFAPHSFVVYTRTQVSER
jgi:maltooligosyltrehalose trehalohydrolase